MAMLSGFRVVQMGRGLAAAVCGRLLADIGAEVRCTDAGSSTPLSGYLNLGKAEAGTQALSIADLIVAEGSPARLRALGHDAESLRRRNPNAALVLISPFGQTGPRAGDSATDLTLLYASGIARLLTGQVDDLSEAPIRPIGHQSAFIGGIAAACAGMHAALLRGGGAVIDISIQEALATLAMTELARAGLTGRGWSRKRVGDGNGATVCILPARDGYVAISPREDHQWQAWLGVMGFPAWGRDPRFARKPDRVTNWDALHALMSEWSHQHDKQSIADMAQAAHVPSFPLREPAEQFGSAQLAHRKFWRVLELAGQRLRAPGPPFGILTTSSPRADLRPRTDALPLTDAPPSPPSSWPGLTRSSTPERSGPITPEPHGRHEREPPPARQLPLSGVRVLDFSWVIAGPTTTRYLAAMGAEVIKVEAPGRGDPGRASELHTVLGQAKRGIVLDLKHEKGREVARALAARCDVLVENFATGVMDRLGLGADALRAENPSLVYLSASGMGRLGPEAGAVAYGTLLQCYAGFAGLNRRPGVPPRVGFAWLDPMCGLMLAFIVAASLWQRRHTGIAARIDFSMLEGMLWTMAEPLLMTQLAGPVGPAGNRSDRHRLHDAFRCAGDDAWISVVADDEAAWSRVCDRIGLNTNGISGSEIASWLATQDAVSAASLLRESGVAAEPLADSRALVASDHLRARGFWDDHGPGVLPGLPWQASFGRQRGEAPGLGADTDRVLEQVLGFAPSEIQALRQSGALG